MLSEFDSIFFIILSESPAEDFKTELHEDGTLSVYDIGNSDQVVIPRQIDGKDVNVIPGRCFSSVKYSLKKFFNENAPSTYESRDDALDVPWEPIDTDYTVYYYQGTKVFSPIYKLRLVHAPDIYLIFSPTYMIQTRSHIRNMDSYFFFCSRLRRQREVKHRFPFDGVWGVHK